MSDQYYDALIIGSGGAGLTASIFAKKRGLKVAIISKVHALQSHTAAAQGGINAALANKEEDEIAWHIYDTIKASDFLADQDSVKYMCSQAPDIIRFLEEIGMNFTRSDSGKIDQKVYGGQTTHFGSGKLAKRVCYSKDRTGASLMDCLFAKAKELQVEFFNYYYALKLVIENQKCVGVVCLNIADGKIEMFRAANIIVATGGGARVYGTNTVAKTCSGDGFGLVARAGLLLQDMEFVQFHPTAISRSHILISEAARAAGGRLINGKGERFMHKYAKKLLELAPRDLVARSIAQEILEGRGAGVKKDHVLLDLTHLSREEIKNTLPSVFENCQQFLGLDPSTTPIPVSPAAHYNMGGIAVDANCRVINPSTGEYLSGLLAIGEAASISVHGANRLGCNSLLDIIAFGKFAAEQIEGNLVWDKCEDREIIEQTNRWMKALLIGAGKEKSLDIERELGSVMDKYVGVFRNRNSLEVALGKIDELSNRYAGITLAGEDLSWNSELIEYLELGNMLVVARSIIVSALYRLESRGAHYRDDFPHRSDQFRLHSNYKLNEDSVSYRKIRIDPDVDFCHDQIRKY